MISSASDPIECAEFLAQQLNSDRCRRCFGQRSAHIKVATCEQQQAVGRATTDGGSYNKNDDAAREFKNLDREQLIGELKRMGQIICENERKYLDEIEKLRSELKRSQAESLAAGERNSNLTSMKFPCDKCQYDGLELSNELVKLKQECEKLQLERDQSRDELRALEKEMEELHDNFKEDESEQFEQIKQELDVALKNCKILQIRLNKSERQYNQLEQIKLMLEKQLEENLNNNNNISNRLQVQHQNSCDGFVQLGSDFVKLSTAEYDQLLRDLNDTIEREKDLQEQIKYSQEEAQLKGDRLQAAEMENEVLLSKINKLSQTNCRLIRSRNSSLDKDSPMNTLDTESGEKSSETKLDSADLVEQNEQLKLALDLAQSECNRLRGKQTEFQSNLEAKEAKIKELDSEKVKLEEELANLRRLSGAGGDSGASRKVASEEQCAKLELECRQLRTKLVRIERECKQLKAQLEVSMNNNGRQSRASANATGSAESHSESSLRDQLKQLREQCEILKSEKVALERRQAEVAGSGSEQQQTSMERDLLEKMKKQLNSYETDLANSKSRIVELDLENAKLQRQTKQLSENMETILGASSANASSSSDSKSYDLPIRKVKFPPESRRDSMTRQELRQLLKDIEDEVSEWVNVSKSKDGVIRELQKLQDNSKSELTDDVISLQDSLLKERQVNTNLSVELEALRGKFGQLQQLNSMFERERVSMEEELDKLRQVIEEIRANNEELKKSNRVTGNKLKEIQFNYQQLVRGSRSPVFGGGQPRSAEVDSGQQQAPNWSLGRAESGASSPSNDLLLMTRDLAELKVKNSFLMRQLEIVREDSNRQLEDLKQTNSVQQRKAIELALLELKEKHLAENQALRDELNELKQKVATSQRAASQAEEEANGERERVRNLERDFRRDKSQKQQKIEQLEAQLAIERRSNEFKLREFESQSRIKERDLLNMQDKCVQLERDLKRWQNKFQALEESNETKEKLLIKELDIKKKELNDLQMAKQILDEDYFDIQKRFKNEKLILNEALESIKKSFDEKLLELKTFRELLQLRQEQTFKERQNAQDRLDKLNLQLMKMSEFETQSKLLKHQLNVQEKQFESIRKEVSQLREDKLKLKNKCDDFERRCQIYEKRELINKTSNISKPISGGNTTNNSSGASSFLKPKSLFSYKQNQATLADNDDKRQQPAQNSLAASATDLADAQRKSSQQCSMIEKLSSKINDQRHLINLLKQQHFEAQLELKQLKLLESSERNKLSNRILQLQSQLNECEEKLVFEITSNNKLLVNQQTLNDQEINGSDNKESLIKNLKLKLDFKWNDERQNLLNTIQQQQQQNDSLLKDLKKLNQSYDLLRLQSKQLDLQNHKLCKKLIEYQQLAQNNNKLNECLMAKRELEQFNGKLVKLMQGELKPLCETVRKILTTLDSNDSGKSDSNEANQLAADCSSLASNSNSTQRPLMTNSKASGQTTSESETTKIATAQPAHQVAQQGPAKSRLSKFLSPKSASEPKEDSLRGASAESEAKAKSSKAPKKVKIKSSSLGITVTEKKQLRKHLDELNNLLVVLASQESQSSIHLTNDSPSSDIGVARSGAYQERASSEVTERPLALFDNSLNTSAQTRRQRGLSYTPSQNESGLSSLDMDGGHCGQRNSSTRLISWATSSNQNDSDLDSEQSYLVKDNNAYKRFPQAAPLSSHYAGYSLTDYDSETSLASDYSAHSVQSAFGQQKLARAGATREKYLNVLDRTRQSAGAESDSGLARDSQEQLKSNLKASKRRLGGSSKLRSRLTSTLRNISRSISQGLGSETDLKSTSSQTNARNVDDLDEDSLKEIRV